MNLKKVAFGILLSSAFGLMACDAEPSLFYFHEILLKLVMSY